MNIIDPQPEKKLYRSRDKMIGGVCGGLAGYFGVDRGAIRAAFALSLLLGLAGAAVYMALWMAAPLEPHMIRR